MRSSGALQGTAAAELVAAVSVGIVDGKMVLDLDYALDSTAEVDMNIVMTASGKLVEVQGTAESNPFDVKTMNGMVELAGRGVRKLIGFQRKALSRR